MRISPLACCLLLAACGGGGGSPSQPVPNPASEANGTIDAGFADRGLFAIDPAVVSSPSTVREIVPLEDGGAIVGGDGPYVLKLTPDGALDPTFATNGIDATRRDTFRQLQGVIKIARSGTDHFIVVEFHRNPCAGPCRSGTTLPQLVARRIDSRGNVDIAYGQQGFVTLRFAFAQGNVIELPGGRIAAFSSDTSDSGANFFQVSAADETGRVDDAFAQRAIDAVTSCGTRFGMGATSLRRVSAAPAGDKIIVAAQWAYSADGGVCVSRLNADGSLDTSFAADGHRVYVDPMLATFYTTFIKTLVRGDGEILVALGTVRTSGFSTVQKPAILFLTPNGAKDDHATPGVIVWLMGDAALQPNGKIVIAGAIPGTTSPPQDDWLITRLTPDASALDLDFGPSRGGSASLRVQGETLWAEKVAIDPFGRILVGGQLASSGRGAVMRFR